MSNQFVWLFKYYTHTKGILTVVSFHTFSHLFISFHIFSRDSGVISYLFTSVHIFSYLFTYPVKRYEIKGLNDKRCEMKNSELCKDVKCNCERECEKIWNKMWKDMKWSVNCIVKALWNEMKWIVNWVWKNMKLSVNWCEMKSSVRNRVWMNVNGYEWIWMDMKWISVRDSHWISQCEPNSSMLRFS
jgi:hypothetical protein